MVDYRRGYNLCIEDVLQQLCGEVSRLRGEVDYLKEKEYIREKMEKVTTVIKTSIDPKVLEEIFK